MGPLKLHGKIDLMQSRDPLTILQLVPKLSTGGVERGTVQIAEALVKENHRSIVVAEEGPLTEELLNTGSEYINWPIGGKKLSTFFFVNKLQKLCLSEGVDIVHARSRLPAWIARIALSKIEKTQRPLWITTVHGPYTVGLYSQVMVSGQRIIAISNFIREYILNNYKHVDEKKIITIPRGVDEKTHFFSFSPDKTWQVRWRQELGTKADLPILTLPARLTRWKGQTNFIEMLRILKDKGISFHGLIVGGTSKNKKKYKNELETLIKNSSLSENISFLGNRADLREIMSVSNVVFSVTDEPEAFGRTTAEALSLGTPVVGYAHGGTKEIMSNWFPGGLVSVGDISEAANRTQGFLKAPPSISEINPFTSKKMKEHTINIYEELAYG